MIEQPHPIAALTPAQAAALDALDADARAFTGLVRDAHAAGYDVLTDADVCTYACPDTEIPWPLARDRALELGLLAGTTDAYSHREVTP